MKYLVSVVVTVSDQSAKDIAETLDVNLPASDDFEYEVTKVVPFFED